MSTTTGSVDRDGMVAVFDVGGSDALATVVSRLDAIRDEGVRAAVIEVQPDADADNDEVAGLQWAVLPTVAVWTARPSPRAIAIGLACDIRVCDAATDLGAAAELRGAAAERLATVTGRAIDELETVLRGEPDWLTMGLVSAVAPEGEAAAEGRRIADVIASRGPIATQLGKEAIWRGLRMPLEQALRFETDLTLLLQTTKDRAEGVRAFIEKRTPQFEGE